MVFKRSNIRLRLCAASVGLVLQAIGANAQTFAYVTNSGSNTISAFTIDASTGTLAPISGSPFPSGTQPLSVAIHPSGRFAYVSNGLSNDVSAYSINPSTGALTPVPGSPFAAGIICHSVAIDPSGRFAYV